MSIKTTLVTYPVTLTKDGVTIMATFVDVPEAITFGEDETEALWQAADALESALSFYSEKGVALPTPSKPRYGQKTVTVSVAI